jgi:hypothetical protein
MSSIIQFPVKSYTAGEAIGAYVRVKKSAGTVVIAGAGEVGIGVTEANVENGGLVPVALWNGFGTVFMKAGAAISINAPVYPIAAGKIDDAQATQGAPIGYAEEAATADGDVIEVLLRGVVSGQPTASADQAVPTDLATVIAWITNVRLALIANGTIKGAA